MELDHSFTFALPHEDFTVTNAYVRQQFGLPEGRTDFSLLEIWQLAPKAAAELDRFSQNKPATWTAAAVRTVVHVAIAAARNAPHGIAQVVEVIAGA